MHGVAYLGRMAARPSVRASVLILAASSALSGCLGAMSMPSFGSISETSQHGYVVSPLALEQVPVGSSKEQVIIALGTPSTSAQYDAEVFYYISQTRQQKAKFMLSEVVGQRVLAVYFDRKGSVARIADYGLQDGKVFDFIARTTPTGGKDLTFIQQVLSGAPSPANIFNR